MRPASIASALSQPPSRDWRPKSPKLTVLPRVALPLTVPRWLFRYLTRLGISGIGGLLGQIITVIDPNFDADVALSGPGFGEAEIDPGAQRRERNAPEHASFLASHFRAAQAPRHLYLDSLGSALHGVVHGPLHGAAEADALLQLFGNVLRDQLRIDLGPIHFHGLDVDVPVGQGFESLG